MQTIQRLSHATPESILEELFDSVQSLLCRVRLRIEVMDEIEQIRNLLASLPLPRDAYGNAFNRLSNAHRYLTSREPGAACYELNRLAGGLQGHRTPAPPRRRIR